MATVAPTAATWTWPPEVLAYAEEQGVSTYLDPLLDATRRAFPQAPLQVYVEEDPEIAGERHIVFLVDVTGRLADELFGAENRWTEDLFACCPSTHVCVFRIGMVASAERPRFL